MFTYATEHSHARRFDHSFVINLFRFISFQSFLMKMRTLYNEDKAENQGYQQTLLRQFWYNSETILIQFWYNSDTIRIGEQDSAEHTGRISQISVIWTVLIVNSILWYKKTTSTRQAGSDSAIMITLEWFNRDKDDVHTYVFLVKEYQCIFRTRKCFESHRIRVQNLVYVILLTEFDHDDNPPPELPLGPGPRDRWGRFVSGKKINKKSFRTSNSLTDGAIFDNKIANLVWQFIDYRIWWKWLVVFVTVVRLNIILPPTTQLLYRKY